MWSKTRRVAAVTCRPNGLAAEIPDRMADPLTDPARFRPADCARGASAVWSARAQIAALSDADARRGVTMIHDSYYILHRLIAGLPDRGWRRRPLEKPIRLAWTLAAVGRGYLGRVLSGGP